MVIKKFVAKALQWIEEDDANIGDPLGKNHNIDLTGYRKVKLRIRIVYHMINGEVEITESIAIDERGDEEVYREAFERLMNSNEIGNAT